jgi:hypothetical protein
MGMPGYTAEVSLYRIRRSYRAPSAPVGAGRVSVQAAADDAPLYSGPAVCNAAGGDYREDAEYTYCSFSSGVTIRCGKLTGQCSVQFCGAGGRCWERNCYTQQESNGGLFPSSEVTYCDYSPSNQWITTFPNQSNPWYRWATSPATAPRALRRVGR